MQLQCFLKIIRHNKGKSARLYAWDCFRQFPSRASPIGRFKMVESLQYETEIRMVERPTILIYFTQGMARSTIPIYARPLDGLFCVLLCYYLFSCFFIERHYCVAPLDPDSEDPLLNATFEYSQKYNPLFLSRPEWLRVCTCISAYILGAGYLLALPTFALGLESMRLPILMFGSFKLYALTLYYWMEFNGPIPTPNVPMFLAADGPYLLGLLIMFARLLPSTHPFSRLDTSSESGTKKRR